MEASVERERDKKQEADFISNSNIQVELELESSIDELETYLKQNPSSYAVAEDMGDKHLFIAKMQGSSIDHARLAGNSFLNAADIAAEKANKRKEYGREEFDTVKRNLQKAKESFELYAAKAETEKQAETGKAYVENIGWRLSFFDEKWHKNLSVGLKSYPIFKTLPAKRD